ncbi:MAG: T9SS type A sorting domain-containing protein [Saprospiraceae bacterium]|nr:T9SS type A sorting domain-containing protein [Saprospiraceae bacterium]
MKKNLLVYLLAFSAITNLSAQGSDFAPVGAKWYYSELNFALKVIPHVTESVAKENYQGKWCSKLVHSSIGPLPSPTYIYTQNDTVFFYSTVTNQFEMLYDFTAEVGDTWVVGGVLSFDNEGNALFADTIRVDSISSIAINGGSLKVWHISHGIFYDWGRRIFERVGNESLFAPKFAMWELEVGGLRCFETPDTAFHFVPYPCDTIYSTISTTDAPNAADGIAVFPNPFHEAIYIRSDPLSAPGTFLLFSPIGNVVRRQKFSGSVEIGTASLPAGIYFWSLEMEGVMLRSGKCVKE